MKRWALVVVLLYGLIIIILTLPVIFGAFRGMLSFTKEDIKRMFEPWPYWLGFFVFMAAQAALLTIPVRVSGQRPISKRTVILPVGKI
jgi:hypothetical protein